MTAKKQSEPSAEELAARELVRLAKEPGLSPAGPEGLLKQFTKNVLEAARNEEMTEPLGHEKNRAAEGRDSTNVRNGTRPKTVLTHATGQVDLEVPRDRDGTFEPVIVKKRQRRLTEVDEIVLSLSARGLTTGEISAHFAQIYGASVSKETISRITDRVVEEMLECQNRPLEEVYAAVFIDAIMVKVRDGQVANRPIYAAIGVTLAGDKDVLGLWAGTGGEGAKFWMSVLTDIRNRGTRDVFFVVCDGLKGLPEVVGNVWPLTTLQTCIINLIRNTFGMASKKPGHDLPRVGKGTNKKAKRAALIPDPRNDENLIVAQTHLAMIHFHNRVLDKVPASVPDTQKFARARKRVTLHYQWMIRHDYLPRICRPAAIDEVFTNGRKLVEPGASPASVPTMSVEFSVAAFRLGHSMVRPAYNWNGI